MQVSQQGYERKSRGTKNAYLCIQMREEMVNTPKRTVYVLNESLQPRTDRKPLLQMKHVGAMLVIVDIDKLYPFVKRYFEF